MEQCTALKMTSQRCTSARHNAENPLCKLHKTLEAAAGPNTFALKQLSIAQKAEHRALDATFDARMTAAVNNHNADNIRDVAIERTAARVALKTTHRIAKHDLERRQQELIDTTGINPDAAANLRREAVRVEAQRRWAERRRRINEALRAEVLADIAFAQQPVHVAQRGIAQFIADPQNVHTSEAVRQTKDIVARVLTIPVPEEYRWHPINSSKTPFEIGLECKLSQKAAWQMISQYAQDVAVYDIEPGIYGKVLDSVWQYVKSSPNKDELCVIARQELQDNVGMCAQGNLSRVCNILSGYLDGVAPPESIADKLGRLLPPLTSIDDAYDRFIQAVVILKDNRVPRDEWTPWLDALVVDDTDQGVLDDVLGSS